VEASTTQAAVNTVDLFFFFLKKQQNALMKLHETLQPVN
jgi:hypothetical protein